MKKLVNSSLALVVVASVGLSFSVVQAHAQETREYAAAHLRKPEPKEMDPNDTTAAPFAQKLVDEALAKHPEVVLLAVHAGAPKYNIVASNFGRIGKIGDEDDLRCIHTGKDNLEVNKEGIHFEDETPLRDRSGKIIGALGIVFRYKPGDDKIAMHKIAIQVAAEMKAKTPSEKVLLGPA